ncbi:MAG: hypothetical protein V7L06_16680 [Nostoc sp.]
MGIALNAVSTDKSKSLVIITSALAAMAVSKITVSSGSRSWGVESGTDKAMPHVQSPTHLTQ